MDIYQIIISSMLTVVVLTGLSMMSRVRTAASGNLLSSLAVFVGIGVTLLFFRTVELFPDAVRADPDHLLIQAGLPIFIVLLFHVLPGQTAFSGCRQPCQHKKTILHSDNTSL